MTEQKVLNHIPVLLQEAVDYLNIKSDGIYIDCTLGRAGHSKAILDKLVTGKLYAFDQDTTAINESQNYLKAYQDKFILIKSNFINLNQELSKLNITKVDGILYDLGISSPQVDEDARGFSYKNDAKLDMRMDQDQSLTAWDIVNKYSFQDLKYIIKTFGEEKFASNIANNIVKYRSDQPINTTSELTTIIKQSLPMKVLNKHHHPAKKTFQALRIAVNNELNNLKLSLLQALQLVKKDGRIVVISFHSLEDRIVKNVFQQTITDPQGEVYAKLPFNSNWKSNYQILTKKPVLPTQQEVNLNPRARSAKLRVIMRIN